MDRLLDNALDELQHMVPKLRAMEAPLRRLGEAMLASWAKRGKVLTAGNGGSACDAMHLAEELSVRFMKNRRALAAVALCADPTALTCAANDYGFDEVFARQVEALGNAGDVLIVFSTSGNSKSVIRAVEVAKTQGLITAAFLGKGGGKLAGACDIELIVPAQFTHRVQEGHQILYHTLCEWVEARIE
jgi:D-sedoheptulose 7-phosphate isomerase